MILLGQETAVIPGTQPLFVICKLKHRLRVFRHFSGVVHHDQRPEVLPLLVARGAVDHRLKVAGKKTPVILPGLHHHGKIGKLGGALVDVQPIEVMLHDALGRVPLGIALTLVDLHQHIEQIAQDMSAAHAGVDALNVLRVQGSVLFADLRKLGLYSGFLLRLVQVVVPIRFQLVIGVSLHPQTTQTVFHHVTDNPVRGKELGGGRNLLFFDFLPGGPAKHRVFGFRVPILVQPADDFHLPALFDVEIILVNVVGQAIDHAVLIDYRHAEQKLGIVVGLLEQSGQNLIQGIALLNEQQPEQFINLIVPFEPHDHLLLVCGERQFRAERSRHQIRL